MRLTSIYGILEIYKKLDISLQKQGKKTADNLAQRIQNKDQSLFYEFNLHPH